MPRIRLSAAAAVTAFACLMPAHADAKTIARVTADTPIAVAGNTVAWSDLDAKTGRYHLMLQRGSDAPVEAAVSSQRRPFDVSGAVTTDNREVLLYTRCDRAVRAPDGYLKREYKCDIYRYDATNFSERRMTEVSSSTADEAWPVIDSRFGARAGADTIAFVRRDRHWDKNAGEMISCDVPYAGSLSRPEMLRRLDRGSCGETVGMAIRRAPTGQHMLVQVTDVNFGGAGSSAEVRSVPISGKPGRVLARAGGGEAGYSGFTSPSITSTAVWVTTTGSREGVDQGVVRISYRGGEPRLKTFHNVAIAQRYIRQEGSQNWFLRGTNGGVSEDEPYESSASCTADAPCELVYVQGTPESALKP